MENIINIISKTFNFALRASSTTPVCTIQIHIVNSSNYLFHVSFVWLIGWLLGWFCQNYNKKKRNSITSRTKHWKFSLQLHLNIKYSNSLFGLDYSKITTSDMVKWPSFFKIRLIVVGIKKIRWTISKIDIITTNTMFPPQKIKENDLAPVV